MTAAPTVSDALAKRNILLLAISQALYSNVVIILFASASLVGLMLAPSKGWATAPITSYVIGAAITTIPASFLMQRFGRKPGFMVGALAAMSGALVCAYAIYTANFMLFCAGTMLYGMFQATSGFHRFAANETASPSTRHMAISWVLTGGIIAAVTGTLLANATAELLAPFTFMASYIASAFLALIAIGNYLFLRLPRTTAEEIAGPKRSWGELLQQPRLVVAMASAMISYGLMNLMMTAAPVAMVGCGFASSDASWVIQWHVLAMFVPSFFTGHLMRQWGVAQVTAIGMLLLVAAAVVAMLGLEFDKFAVSLILLGLGWNFGFIGATTLLTETYRPAERGKVQAVNDFGVAVTMSIASLGSGKLLDIFGWNAVAITIYPLAALALVLIVWLIRHPSEKTA